jgi:prophage antirepressor-like protein
MNTAIKKMFEYEGRVVRVELFEGEPWWAAKDVAEVLGYSAEFFEFLKREGLIKSSKG